MSSNAGSSRSQLYDNDGDGPEKKRRRVVTVRRPLSCTECKRRKTKCSSLGMTPCTSCVQRGKPEECRWESVSVAGGAAIQPTDQAFALASEVETLKHQLQELHNFVHRGAAASGSQSFQGQSPLPTSHPTPSEQSSADHLRHSDSLNTASPLPGDTALLSATDVDKRLESSVSVLENLVEDGDATTRPTFYLRTSRTRPSRIPPPLDQATRVDLLLDYIYDILPERAIATRLTQEYFQGSMQYGWHILHTPSFLKEEADFYALDTNIQRSETDPAWMALYLMVLALAVHAMDLRELEILFPLYDTDEVSRLRLALYQASMLALEVAKCDSIPQIRHIQVLILGVPMFFHFGSSEHEKNTALRHIATAITTAQWLGLDQIRSDFSNVPIQDVAFRECSIGMAFELSKRLFHFLSFLDGLSWKRPGQWRLAEVTTRASAIELPLNLNDQDLLKEPYRERPVTEATHVTLARIGSLFATQTRLYMRDSRNGDELTYEEVLIFDVALRGVLDQCPSPLIESVPVNWMHISLFCSIHYRFLRLHRPFMARGYIDNEYEASKICCINSAKSIIVAQQRLMQCPHLRPGFTKRWILSAALVLTVDLVISIDLSHPSDQLSCKRENIFHALEVFRQHSPADKTPHMSSQCARIIEGLLKAADERTKSRQMALHPGGDLQDFFDGVSTALVARTNEPGMQPLAPASDFSILDFFNSDPEQNESGAEIPFDFNMFGGWGNLGSGA